MEHDGGVVCFRVINQIDDTDKTAFVSWEELECERCEGGHGDRLLLGLMVPSSSPWDDTFDNSHFIGHNFAVTLNDEETHASDPSRFVANNADVCSLLAKETVAPESGWDSDEGRRVMRERALRIINTVISLTSARTFPTHSNVSCASLTLLVVTAGS